MGKSYLYYKRDYENAIKYFKKAIEQATASDYDYSEAYAYLGGAYFIINQYDSAMDSFDEAIKKDSTYAEAYNCIGYIYHYKKQNSDSIAIDYYNKVINLYNRHIQYKEHSEPEATTTTYPSPNFVEIGDIYHDLGNNDRAIEFYNRAIEINANDALLHKKRGNCIL